MRDLQYLIVMDVILSVGISLDLYRTLKSGRASLRFRGTVTREHQPQRYWRYVYQDYAVLVLCFAVFVWAIWWPDSLR